MGRYLSRIAAVSLLGLLVQCISSASERKTTHAAIEIHPELLSALAQALDYPYQVVDYDGGEARSVLPQKGRWGVGETGHLKKLDLFLRGPDDISLAFDSEPGAGGESVPIAHLQLRLRGPAEAEWWSKLPLDGEWRKVTRFRRRITLLIHAKAAIVVSKRKGRNPRVSLAFDKVRGRDVELNVRRCPPWLDSILEGWFDVAEHVNGHISREVARKTQLDLPAFSVPFSKRRLVLEEVRPQVRNGILRVELVVGSQ